MSTVDVVSPVLPKRIPKTRRDSLSEQILDDLDEAGLLNGIEFSTAAVRGARVTVETVEAYGLSIEVDAMGDAVQITSPWGLEVIQ